MRKNKRVIPSREDFEDCRIKIIQCLRKSKKPVTLEEIAGHIQRDTKVTDVYCDRLRESAEIQYIPTGGGAWGFVLS